MTSGAQQAQSLNNEAAATASGYTGAANSLGGIPSSIGSSLLMQRLLNPAQPDVTAGIDPNAINPPLTPSELGLG
jgi:hypothetical protein